MCTAFAIKNDNTLYFGRTLDLEYNYNEKIIFTPRNFPLTFRYSKKINNHYSFFGIGIIENNYPLYYDACNEYGLCIAGLNLPFSTEYNTFSNFKINLCSFEIIPYLLSSCKTTYEVKTLLKKCNITNDKFNDNYSTTKLHYMISDNNSSIVIEIINKNIIIYDNPVGVLTNEPSFPSNLEYLNNFSFLSNKNYNLDLGNSLNLTLKTKGSHLIGLPGDNTSISRFIKMTFVKKYFIFNKKNIGELFNIFNLVFEINGLNLVDEKNNKYYKTIYSCIYDNNSMILYFKSFDSHTIKGFRLKHSELNNNKLVSYNLYNNDSLIFIN